MDYEQYEKYKADWLYALELHGNEGWNLDALDAVELINLLKQSTWIGNIIQPLLPSISTILLQMTLLKNCKTSLLLLLQCFTGLILMN